MPTYDDAVSNGKMGTAQKNDTKKQNTKRKTQNMWHLVYVTSRKSRTYYNNLLTAPLT